MNLQLDKMAIALCILIPLILAVNVGLWVVYQNRRHPGNNRFIHRASLSLTHTWDKEDRMLEELSDNVKKLKDTPSSETEDSPQPPGPEEPKK